MYAIALVSGYLVAIASQRLKTYTKDLPLSFTKKRALWQPNVRPQSQLN